MADKYTFELSKYTPDPEIERLGDRVRDAFLEFQNKSKKAIYLALKEQLEFCGLDTSRAIASRGYSGRKI